jgi:ABC-type multidrug transport system ATPase subunit
MSIEIENLIPPDTDAGIVWHQLGAEDILQPFSFSLANGRVCAIIGPSGAGKSTLLKLIANSPDQVFLYNRTSASKETKSALSSAPKFSVTSLHPTQLAWLQQDDSFFDFLSVQETLDLAAFFEGTKRESSRRIGLREAARVRFLSGGERRRLSVAVELLSREEIRVLIADEPTSGLDSARSYQVVKLLQELPNIPCFVTLHQARSSIWHELIDDVILMARGRVCWAGDKNEGLRFFESHGYECPPATNPAEFLIDLVAEDPDDRDKARQDRARMDDLADAFQVYQNEQSKRQKDTTVIEYHDSSATTKRSFSFRWIRRFAALIRRSWRQNIRYTTINLFRLLAATGNAWLLAQMFPTVRGTHPTVASIADRVALLSFGAINMCMLSFMKTIELFSKEKPVVERERRRKQYSALEYLLAKAVAELPLDALFAAMFTTTLKYFAGLLISWDRLTLAFSLMTVAGASLGFAFGSWAPTSQMAQQGGLPILIVLMVVGVINPSGVDPSKPMPFILEFVKKFSPFAHCIEALCLGEYPGMTFYPEPGENWFKRFSKLPKMGGLAMVRNGDQVIDALGLRGKTFEGSMKSLLWISGFNLLSSWIGLLFHQNRKRTKPTQSSYERNKSRIQSGLKRSQPVPVVGNFRL